MKEGLLEFDDRKRILLMKVLIPTDLSATWKMLMHRGAAKVAHYPYHCYSIHSDNLAYFKTDNNPCTYFKEYDNQYCICWEVNHNEYLEKLRTI